MPETGAWHVSGLPLAVPPPLGVPLPAHIPAFLAPPGAPPAGVQAAAPGSPRFRDLADLVEAARDARPTHCALLLRGLPGSGKSSLARRLREAERQHGAQPPRIMSLDDYFLTVRGLAGGCCLPGDDALAKELGVLQLFGHRISRGLHPRHAWKADQVLHFPWRRRTTTTTAAAALRDGRPYPTARHQNARGGRARGNCGTSTTPARKVRS